MSISSSLSTGPRAFYHWIPPPDRALPFDPPPQTHSTEAFSKNHTHITAMPCRTFASAAGAVRTPSDMESREVLVAASSFRKGSEFPGVLLRDHLIDATIRLRDAIACVRDAEAFALQHIGYLVVHDVLHRRNLRSTKVHVIQGEARHRLSLCACG